MPGCPHAISPIQLPFAMNLPPQQKGDFWVLVPLQHPQSPPACAIPPRILRTAYDPPPRLSLLTLAHCSPGHGGEEGPEGLGLGKQQEFWWLVKHEHWGVSVQGLGTDGGWGGRKGPQGWGKVRKRSRMALSHYFH